MKRLRVTAPARLDLKEIWEFIAEDSAQAADRHADELGRRMGLLRGHPLAGRRCDELCAGLRRLPVGNYAIYYRVGARKIEIMRVLHSARDARRQFADE